MAAFCVIGLCAVLLVGVVGCFWCARLCWINSLMVFLDMLLA